MSDVSRYLKNEAIESYVIENYDGNVVFRSDFSIYFTQYPPIKDKT